MKWLLAILSAVVTAIVKGLKQTPQEKAAAQFARDKAAWEKRYAILQDAYDVAERRWNVAVVTHDSDVERLHAEWYEAAGDLRDHRRAGQRAGFLDRTQ